MKMVSRDFGKVSVWYCFLGSQKVMATSIYKDQEAVIVESRLDFMDIMAVEGRVCLVIVMSG